jgi:hypothetical protein
VVIAGTETGKRMFKWLHWRRKAMTHSVAEEADRIVTKLSNRGETPSAPDPIAEVVRNVGETHADEPRRRARC